MSSAARCGGSRSEVPLFPDEKARAPLALGLCRYDRVALAYSCGRLLSHCRMSAAAHQEDWAGLNPELRARSAGSGPSGGLSQTTEWTKPVAFGEGEEGIKGLWKWACRKGRERTRGRAPVPTSVGQLGCSLPFDRLPSGLSLRLSLRAEDRAR